jgi:autophagy-related protein 9
MTPRSVYQNPSRKGEDALENNGDGPIGQQNLSEHFQDCDLELAGNLIADSRISAGSTAITKDRYPGNLRLAPGNAGHQWLLDDDEDDNDVPASLLVEPREPIVGTPPIRRPAETRQRTKVGKSVQHRTVLGNFAGRSHFKVEDPPPMLGESVSLTSVTSNASKEKALWRWVNVSNLDIFIRDVYSYFEGSGLWCILTDRALHLL